MGNYRRLVLEYLKEVGGNMISDIVKISRLYEITYNTFVKKGIKEKDSFYLLNDILIMICLQEMYNEKDVCLDFTNFKNKIKLYEDGLGTPLFFKKYNSVSINNDFNKTYNSFKNLIFVSESNFETIQTVLGYVLEKHINRRKTGSYYTPDDTTKYITNYSIFIALFNLLDKNIQLKTLKIINNINKKYNLIEKSKFENQYELIKYNVDLNIILNELYSNFDDNELKKINDTLNSMKIIDPTCGSGAFIITAFDFIVSLKEKINYKIKMNVEEEIMNIVQILHGLDNSYEAISLLKMRLILKIISKGQMPKNFDEKFSKNFILADAFTGKDYVISKGKSKSFDWKKFGHRFDCIIGNPPYVESKGMILTNFQTLKCGNLYAYTIERSYNILKDNGVLSFIVPLSLVSTSRMALVREYMYNNSSKLFISTFADRPGCIFKGVHQRLTIFFANKSYDDCEFYTSSYQYWYNDERKKLFKNFKYILNNDIHNLPKIGNSIESSILQKVNKIKNILPIVYNNKNTKNKIYLSTRLGLWSKCFINKPSTNEIKEINCDNKIQKLILNAFFNSSTFYFLWILLSDCWHITFNDIMAIKFNYDNLTENDIKKICSLSVKLDKDLEKNRKYIGSKQVEYEYKHKLSKKIIDEIDIIIGKEYGLSEEEINYIIQFAYKYRMNDTAEEGE